MKLVFFLKCLGLTTALFVGFKWLVNYSFNLTLHLLKSVWNCQWLQNALVHVGGLGHMVPVFRKDTFYFFLCCNDLIEHEIQLTQLHRDSFCTSLSSCLLPDLVIIMKCRVWFPLCVVVCSRRSDSRARQSVGSELNCTPGKRVGESKGSPFPLPPFPSPFPL